MKKRFTQGAIGLLLVMLFAMPLAYSNDASAEKPDDMGFFPWQCPTGPSFDKMGEDPNWRELRKEILLADLQIEVDLSPGQMEQLDQLCILLKQRLIAKAMEIHAIREEMRDLWVNWEENFEQIVHLEFQVQIKEVEWGHLFGMFSAAVNDVLTTAQSPDKPLVMKVLFTAYHFYPQRDGGEEDMGSRGGQ